MKDEENAGHPIEFDVTKLLGFGQISKLRVDGIQNTSAEFCSVLGVKKIENAQLGRLSNKIGAGENCT